MSLDPSIAAALASLQARRDSIDRAITALLALDDASANGNASPESDVQAPRRIIQASSGGGAEGARRVLHATPNKGYTAAELAQAMRDDGWVTPSKNPRAAARAAGNRLRREPAEHVFFENGRFVYRPPSTELSFDNQEANDAAAH
jgi:predicted O-methyltransferase YrrM